ncbi:transcription cofactor vestigial-like protein 3 isoform X2 [Sapajus apella]|uniref:Transcription cofactor vestigial-like protein 3 isoform X2 n=1 Tax=Sapajus apella TaxID=9515 RepID=A0A6J3HSH8_SAPAP|nr:transcription cofactor vestigial-like protein 3 isoform X2 [Sapajus apella]
MSCAEVMYHPQPYGASQYLPNPRAATTGPTACYQPAPQPGQQKKLAVFSKMQDSLEVTLPSKQEEEDEEEEEEEEEKDQPAEMEYLNSRCVLFTYFQGDIGSVVDEHFSRALGQAITLHPESAISKSKMGLTPLWRDSSALSSQRNSFSTSFWTSSYQPPPAPCLGGVHPDFQVTGPPGTFSAADPSPWPGHSLHQTGPAPPPPVSESWPYPLTSQVYSIKIRIRNHHGTETYHLTELGRSMKPRAHWEKMASGFSIQQKDMKHMEGEDSVMRLTLVFGLSLRKQGGS